MSELSNRLEERWTQLGLTQGQLADVRLVWGVAIASLRSLRPFVQWR